MAYAGFHPARLVAVSGSEQRPSFPSALATPAYCHADGLNVISMAHFRHIFGLMKSPSPGRKINSYAKPG
jgi:hypothetical protein